MASDDTSLGLGCAAVAVLFFGSNFLPVKAYDTGDGVFFQWCVCIGIWLVGLCVNVLHPNSAEAPAFQPIAMLGGAIWCTGLQTVVPIVHTIGMAKGLIIWGATAMITGWACGTFGLLGVASQAAAIASWPLNVGGLLLSLLSLVASLFLRPSISQHDLRQRLLAGPDAHTPDGSCYGPIHGIEVAIARGASSSSLAAGSSAPGRGPSASRGEPSREWLGVGLSLCAGLLYGTNFNPPQWLIDRAGSADFPRASAHGIDYVFSHFCGILAASTLYFVLYAALRQNEPVLYPRVVLPALVSGAMWGTAQSLWFVANDALGFAVAFPIILSGPGIVASLWSVLVIGELRGRRNLVLIMVMFALGTSSAVLISLSKL